MAGTKQASLQPPKEYWDDSDWVHKHSTELSRDYPNQWVAVVEKKVVAAGKVIAEVRKIAIEKTGRKEFPVIFAERGMHVYDSVPLLLGFEDVLTEMKLVSDCKHDVAYLEM